MAAAAFNGGGDGLRIIDNVEAKMAIDAISGGWFEAKMAIDTSSVAGGDSGHQRLMVAMDEGGLLCLTVASASVDNRYGNQWRQWLWHLMVEAAFDGV